MIYFSSPQSLYFCSKWLIWVGSYPNTLHFNMIFSQCLQNMSCQKDIYILDFWNHDIVTCANMIYTLFVVLGMNLQPFSLLHFTVEWRSASFSTSIWMSISFHLLWYVRHYFSPFFLFLLIMFYKEHLFAPVTSILVQGSLCLLFNKWPRFFIYSTFCDGCALCVMVYIISSMHIGNFSTMKWLNHHTE